MKNTGFNFLKKAIFTIFLMLMMVSAYGYDINITIAPNVLNIQSQGTVVTVHTDISYSSVNAYSVFLNGIYIKSWKADDQGNFVAKFWMSEVKSLEGLKIGDYNELTLIGYTNDEVPYVFMGTDEIMVIDNLPSGSGH